MKLRAIVAACVLVAGLTFLLTLSAEAHSLLVSSDPASGAKLATSPANVQMTFSEGVEPAFSSFDVIDRTRKSYVAGAPTIDRVKGLVTVPLQPNLTPGNYVVQWKVVSVVDGHLTRGSFAFNVIGGPAVPTPVVSQPITGSNSLTPQPTLEPTIEPLPELPSGTEGGATGKSTAPGVLDVAVRWLDTLLAACVIGGSVFSLLIVPGVIARLPTSPRETAEQKGRAQAGPAPRLQEEHAEIRARLEQRFTRGSLVAGALLILTLGAELVLQAMRVTETDLGSVLSQADVLGAVLELQFRCLS